MVTITHILDDYLKQFNGLNQRNVSVPLSSNKDLFLVRLDKGGHDFNFTLPNSALSLLLLEGDADIRFNDKSFLYLSGDAATIPGQTSYLIETINTPAYFLFFRSHNHAVWQETSSAIEIILEKLPYEDKTLNKAPLKLHNVDKRINIAKMLPNTFYESDFHSFDESVIILNGNGKFMIEDKTIDYDIGRKIDISKGSYHAMRTSDAPTYIIAFTESELNL